MLSAAPLLAQPTTQPAAEKEAAPVDNNAGARDEFIDDFDLLELEIPEVITASRHKESLSGIPQAISVVTKEDIRRSGARSVPEALRLVPGVDVADLSFGNAAVSPRGFHGFISNYTLVLVDGRQLYDSLFGGTVWGSWPFQMEDIERIEVVRGPGGVTWGANAVNGVINIITKDPADQKGLTVTAGGGSRGTFKKYLGYAAVEDKLRIRVSGEYEASDGYVPGGSLLRKLDDEYKSGRANVRAIYDFDENDTLEISAGSSIVDGSFSPTPLALDAIQNSGSQANYLMGVWRHKVTEDNYFDVTAYVNDFHGRPGLKAADYRYQQIAFQAGYTFKPSEQHTLSLGIDSRSDLMNASNSDPQLLTESFVSTGTVGLYIQDEWRFADKWTLNLGGRIDYEYYGGFQPSARAALSYDVTDDSMIWAAVSRSFHTPNAAARFIDMPLLGGLAVTTADRNLDSETLNSYELGYRHRFLNNHLHTNANVYWNEYDDVTTISPRLGPPGLIAYDLDNRAEASTYGVELDAKYAVNSRLTLQANYTYQEMDWRSAVKLQDKDVISSPKHKAMVGAVYSLTDDIRIASNLWFVDATKSPNPSFPFVARRNDPYLRLDIRGEYDFWKKRATFAVGVRNLLDPGHYEGSSLYLNDAQVPRMVYAEVRIRLD